MCMHLTAAAALSGYMEDGVAAACRALYEKAGVEAAGAWVQAAVAHPSFYNARVTGSEAAVPTGGGVEAAKANYVMVLGYLAGHGAWDHFATVLSRGVAVSEGGGD